MSAYRSRWFGLALLTLIYTLNQWSRYSINYLSSVSIKECASPQTESCKRDESQNPPSKQAICDRIECSTQACADCQSCLHAHNASTYNLKYSTCLTEPQYSLLVSYAFILLFALTGLVGGKLADSWNRKNLLAFALVGWSLAMVIQGSATDFLGMLFARILLGFFAAFSAPTSYSMIADLFPPHETGFANGLYSFGVYVGGGLSSLSIILTRSMGWRGTCYMIGSSGIVTAILFLISIPEPIRGARGNPEAKHTEQQGLAADQQQGSSSSSSSPSSYATTTTTTTTDFSRVHNGTDTAEDEDEDAQQQQGATGREEEEEEAAVEEPVDERQPPSTKLVHKVHMILSDRIVMMLYVAATLRFFGGFALAAYAPQFYKRRFPSYNDEYSLLNAFVVSIGGALSSMAGGKISDRWSSSNSLSGNSNQSTRSPASSPVEEGVSARARIPAYGSLLAYPPLILALVSDNFALSMFWLFLSYVFAECWFGPALSILQHRMDGDNRGLAIAGYLFCGSLIGNISPLLIGYVDEGSAESLQYLLLIVIGFSYLSCSIAFWVVSRMLRADPEEFSSQRAEPLLDS